jgi:hypothetical protein
MLPFTPEQFLDIFVSYNDAIWPLQIAAYFLGISAVAMVLRPAPASDRAILAILAAMWLWTGLAYHASFFATINTAAYVFAVLFIAQAAYLAFAAWKPPVRFEFDGGLAAWMGLALVVYAAVLYPLIGLWLGHAVRELPMFGVTPCPVTIFTFGLFLLTTSRLPRGLIAIPFVWSLIGGSAAILLNVPQDWLLLASGFISIPLIVMRDAAR